MRTRPRDSSGRPSQKSRMMPSYSARVTSPSVTEAALSWRGACARARERRAALAKRRKHHNARGTTRRAHRRQRGTPKKLDKSPGVPPEERALDGVGEHPHLERCARDASVGQIDRNERGIAQLMPRALQRHGRAQTRGEEGAASEGRQNASAGLPHSRAYVGHVATL